MTDELTLRVSGKDIYKAVANYLNNTIPKHAVTQEVVDKRIKARLDLFIETKIRNMGNSAWREKSTLDKLIEEEVRKQIKRELGDGILERLISKALK